MNTNIGDYFQKVNPPSVEPPKKQPRFSAKLSKITRRPLKWVQGHRIVAGCLAMLMLLAAITPTAYEVLSARHYQLSAATQKIIGNVDETLAKKLVYDDSRGAYVFNKENMPFDIAGSNTDKEKADRVAAIRMLQAKAQVTQTAKIGGGSDRKDKQLYSSQFPKKFASGATYYDNESQLSFTLVPKFTGRDGDLVGGRLVYPLTSYSGQAIYTVKENGVKEDVVLRKFSGDTVKLSYTLDIPKTLQARLLDSGDIGIYSADPSIYGAAVMGASDDLGAAMKAQEQASKTHLVFAIPAPIVAEADGDTTGVRSRFSLDGNNVDLITTGLAKASYPLSIDPTVVVTNTSQFKTGNNEGMTNLTGNSQISRGILTGGAIGSWGTTAAYNGGVAGTGVVAYGDYMYVVGGHSGNSQNSDVEVAPINSNGTLGAWTTTTSMTDTRAYAGVVAYNGYIYVVGGSTTGWSALGTAEYAKINSNGTLGAWVATSSLPGAISSGVATAYNGYVYMLGGTNGSAQNSVLYAKVNADGTLGMWSSTSSFTTARANHSSFAYNGYMYVIGGYDGGSTYYSDAQFAPINSNGTLGAWVATSGFATARAGQFSAVYNGYVYIYGGSATVHSSLDAFGDTQYAQINASGTLGLWNTTSAIGVKRSSGSGIAYNGYIYAMGGMDGFVGDRTVQYAKIIDAGVNGLGSLTTKGFTTSREGHAMVVYNSYIYALGGFGGSANTFVNWAQYAPIDGNGDITTGNGDDGTWTTTTSFGGANRADIAAVAYNGYMYVFGGYDGSTYYNNSRYTLINGASGTLGAWSNGTALPSARAGLSAFAYNDYMYILGGRTSSGNVTDVYYASIAANGALGSWTSTTALPTAVNRHRVVTYGGYVYSLGGTAVALSTGASRTTGTGLNAVNYAPINGNGTIGTWAATGNMLSTRYEFGAVANGGYIYAIGGFNNGTGSGVLDTVDIAKINSNGTLAAWQPGTPLSTAVGSNGATVYRGYIYSSGGRKDDSTGDTNRLQVNQDSTFIPINNGGSGTLSSWTTSSNTLPTARQRAASVYLNGYAYTFGGVATSTNYVAALNRDGSVGTWASFVGPMSMTGTNVVTYGSYIYVLGGSSSGSVYYGKQNQNTGKVDSWTLTNSFASTNFDAGAVVVGGRIYVLGGVANLNKVYVAQINDDYSLAPWQLDANNLPATRYYIKPVVLNGYIYVVGGYGGSAAQKTVYYSRVNSSGSLTAWQSSGNQLPVATFGSTTLAANGYIYNIDGSAAGAIYYASVDTNGNVGSWQFINSLPASRTYASGVYANGYLYVFGGSVSTTVYYSSVNAIARIARYSQVIDLGTNTNLQSFGFTGQNTDGITLSARAASLNYVFGESFNSSGASYAGTLNTWDATSTISAREGGAVATLNGYIYYMGGYTNSARAEVYYAKANGDGTTGAWTATTSLPQVRDGPQAGAVNGYLYLIGGNNGTSDQATVYYTKPNSDGTISSWSTTTALGSGATNGTVLSVNGVLYVFNDTSDYYSAIPNANGTVSSWSYSWSIYPSAGTASRVVVGANGYMYAYGSGTEVYYSPTASGSLNFTRLAYDLPGDRNMGAAFAYGGYIYWVGGMVPGGGYTAQSAIYYAKTNSNGTIDPWVTSTTVAPGGGMIWPGSVIVNGYFYLVGGYNGSNLNTTYYTSVKRLWGDTVNNARYVQFTVTIDDTTANASYAESLTGILNGIYVDYRVVASPANRLRQGKFFKEGVLQPLIQPNTNNN